MQNNTLEQSTDSEDRGICCAVKCQLSRLQLIECDLDFLVSAIAPGYLVASICARATIHRDQHRELRDNTMQLTFRTSGVNTGRVKPAHANGDA